MGSRTGNQGSSCTVIAALGLAALLVTGCGDSTPPQVSDGQMGDKTNVLDGGADWTMIRDGQPLDDSRPITDGRRDVPPVFDIAPTDGMPVLCGSFPGGQCSPNEVCDIYGCYPGAGGICVPKPGMCPDIWSPVCGCNNQTYSNDCDRLAAGVALQHKGACATVVDGGPQDAGQLCGPFFPGGQCPAGMTCNIQSCGLGAPGTCVWTPQTCPYLWDPVCGCDDKTYANDCIRLKAGVGLKHKGECMLVPPDASPADASLLCGPFFPGGGCPWGMTCDIQSCLPGTGGACVWTPTTCPKLWAPVCGCDGQTYANDCYRVVAGVALMHPGGCAPVPDGGPADFLLTDGVGQPCGPFPGGQCVQGEVCDIYSCLFGASGTCVPKPSNCPFLWAPVCGCNDLTYFNDCIRLMAGVAFKHNGECYPTVVDGGIIISDF